MTGLLLRTHACFSVTTAEVMPFAISVKQMSPPQQFNVVPDRVIQSQLARSTRPPGFNLSVKICIAVYIILVLFVLLLVMHIWVDLQVLQIWDFGSTLKSKKSAAKPSQAAAWGPQERPQLMWLREDVESVYF
jgi:hypothetical protein